MSSGPNILDYDCLEIPASDAIKIKEDVITESS
jgi:hypothetical protein